MFPDADIPSASFLYSLDLFATIISLIGSLFMCYLCMKVPSPKTISVKFIFAIAIADLFYTIANIMSNFEKLGRTILLCVAEANIRQSSFVLSIFFATCTAIVSYKAALPHSTFNRGRFFKLSVIVAPSVYIFITLLGPIMLPEYIMYKQGPINCAISYNEKK